MMSAEPWTFARVCKVFVLPLVLVVAVPLASNWSSNRIDLLDHRAHALEASGAEQDKALRKMIATLARLEQKLDDMKANVEPQLLRLEQKIDARPRRGR